MNPDPSQPTKKSSKFYILLISLFSLFVLSLIFVVYTVQKVIGHNSTSLLSLNSNEISLIEIQGPIYESDDIVRRIKRFKNSSKKALILRINSPGGAVAPSQEIYTEILSARNNKKIIVASLGSLAASGAYYIAAACDKIVADPGTVTGSIGVIAEFPDASKLLGKIGVNFQIVKSGKFKDTGTFDRPMTPAEKRYLQETINDVFQQFVDSVIKCRKEVFQEKLSKFLGKKTSKITEKEIHNHILHYADGRVLTGKNACELGFVDKLGNYYDAVRLAADLAGIKGEPTVRRDESLKLDQIFNSILPFRWLSDMGSSFHLDYRAF